MCIAKSIVASTFIFLVLLCLQWNIALAEIFEGVGHYHQDRQTTRAEACDRALHKSKKDAFSKAGLERFSSVTRETCSEIEEQVECQLYQDTLNTYSGGYIAGYEKTESMVDRGNGSECQILIQANVKEYGASIDPNLTLSASLNEDIFRAGDALSIKGEVSQLSYLYFLGWYPDIDSETYRAINGNSFLNEPVNGAFAFPGSSNSNFELRMEFPANIKKDRTLEFIIIVASKVKISILGEESISSFRARLDAIGRDQWTETSLGYAIVKTRK